MHGHLGLWSPDVKHKPEKLGIFCYVFIPYFFLLRPGAVGRTDLILQLLVIYVIASEKFQLKT